MSYTATKKVSRVLHPRVWYPAILKRLFANFDQLLIHLGAVKRRFREDSIVFLRNVPSFIIRETFPKLTRPAQAEIKRRTRAEKQARREKRRRTQSWYRGLETISRNEIYRRRILDRTHNFRRVCDWSEINTFVQMKRVATEVNSGEHVKHARLSVIIVCRCWIASLIVEVSTIFIKTDRIIE